MAKTKAKCPYLAINIPGERPFVVERTMYEAAMKGVQITDSSLAKETVEGTRYGEIWVLTICHKTGRVRGRMKFYNLLQTKFAENHAYWDFKRDLAKWAESAAKQCSKTKPTKHEAQIKRLEKELKYLHARIPVSPMLRERDSYAGEREYASAWAHDREARKKLALIGGWVLKNRITNATAYKLLEETGLKVQKYGKITASYRRYYAVETENDYWRGLYRVTSGLVGKRKHLYRERELAELLAEHRQSLISYLETKRQIDAIKDQIASIKQLAAMVEPAANETGVVYA